MSLLPATKASLLKAMSGRGLSIPGLQVNRQGTEALYGKGVGGSGGAL